MLKIKLRRLWWACLVALVASYPFSVVAAQKLVDPHALTAPFLVSWTGVWVFAVGGGICAGFVRIADVDVNFYLPMVAKVFLGTFSGVALCLLIDAFTSTESGALAFFAYFASLFSAPLAGGTTVWLSKQRRIDNALNQITKQRTGIDLTDDYNTPDNRFTIDTDYKRSDGNDKPDLH